MISLKEIFLLITLFSTESQDFIKANVFILKTTNTKIEKKIQKTVYLQCMWLNARTPIQVVPARKWVHSIYKKFSGGIRGSTNAFLILLIEEITGI